jgi:hypothetical protein
MAGPVGCLKNASAPLGATRFGCSEKFRRRFDANAMSQRSHQVTAIGRDDDGRTGARGDFGDMSVLDSTAAHTVPGRALQHRQPIGRGQIVYGHASEDLTLDQVRGVERCQPELGRQSSGDREELQATVPSRARPGDLLLGDRVQVRLGRSALRPEVDKPASSTLVSRKTVTATGSALPRPERPR